MHEILHLINEMSPYLLLGFFLAGLMHAFIPGRYYSQYLARPSFRSVIYAALFGVPLPLCSCGVIPTAMSLRREGASKGATTSFLIATPQTGVDSIIATYSLMGLPFAIIRPIAALLTAVFGGTLVNLVEKGDAASSVHNHQDAAMTTAVPTDADCSCSCGCGSHGEPAAGFWGKMKEAGKYAFLEMMEDIGKWLLIGLVVAGLITIFVSESLFAVFQGNTFASMVLVLCIAIPMYLCATGSIPIAVALMIKGLTPGAALVLLMAGPACNMASILVVRKVLGTRTLATYVASIVLGAIGFGVLIDYLQFQGVIDFLANLQQEKACCAEGDSWFAWGCTVVLFMLLFNALVLQRFRHDHHHDHCGCDDHCSCEHGHCGCEHDHCGCEHDHCGCEENSDHAEVKVLSIKGMNCNHCRAAVEKALSSVPGVTAVSVDLQRATADVKGTASMEALKAAVEAVGFSVEL